MSSAEGAENAQSLRMQTPGDGSGDNPPDAYEQAEADVVSSPASTVFVAGGSGFVGAEICSQVRIRTSRVTLCVGWHVGQVTVGGGQPENGIYRYELYYE